jgi:hypothetical protein
MSRPRDAAHVPRSRSEIGRSGTKPTNEPRTNPFVATRTKPSSEPRTKPTAEPSTNPFVATGTKPSQELCSPGTRATSSVQAFRTMKDAAMLAGARSWSGRPSPRGSKPLRPAGSKPPCDRIEAIVCADRSHRETGKKAIKGGRRRLTGATALPGDGNLRQFGDTSFRAGSRSVKIAMTQPDAGSDVRLVDFRSRILDCAGSSMTIPPLSDWRSEILDPDPSRVRLIHPSDRPLSTGGSS